MNWRSADSGQIVYLLNTMKSAYFNLSENIARLCSLMFWKPGCTSGENRKLKTSPFNSPYTIWWDKHLSWPLYGPKRHLLVEVTHFYCFFHKPEVLPFMTGSVKYLYWIQRTRIDRKTWLSYVFQCFWKTGSTSGQDRKLEIWPKYLSYTN